MPIRLNLLAEAQEAEEMRRRDPIKRAVIAGLVLVSLVLMWSSSLQLRIMLARGESGRTDGRISQRTNDYRLLLQSQAKVSQIAERLAALERLSTNRFLNATVLDALQRATIDDVHLLRLKIDQNFASVEAPKPRPGAVAAPAKVIERIVVTLDANDSSPNPGDQINKFKETVAANPYFHGMLDVTNAITLKNLSAPQVSLATGKTCVLFTLECRFRERIR